ncbi:MAG: hypothetical protein AAB532_03820 [Patescibacteria group bacterium]
MVKNGFLWTVITISIFMFLLLLNYSVDFEYIQLRENPSFNTKVLCSDFLTQEDAQDFFIKNGGPRLDKYKLDKDKDGIVCESLPK